MFKVYSDKYNIKIDIKTGGKHPFLIRVFPFFYIFKSIVILELTSLAPSDLIYKSIAR